MSLRRGYAPGPVNDPPACGAVRPIRPHEMRTVLQKFAGRATITVEVAGIYPLLIDRSERVKLPIANDGGKPQLRLMMLDAHIQDASRLGDILIEQGRRSCRHVCGHCHHQRIARRVRRVWQRGSVRQNIRACFLALAGDNTGHQQ